MPSQGFCVGDKYKTSGGLLITVLKLTPKCKYAFVAYFQIRDVRLRVFYDKEGHEFFGEKGLDLSERQLPQDAFLVKPASYAPKKV